MTPARVVALVCALSSAACESKRERAFKELARDINPLLLQMRPAAARVLAIPTTDFEGTIAACWSVEEVLWSLRKVKRADHTNEDVSPPGGDSWTPLAVPPQALLDSRKITCTPGDPYSVPGCAKWCRAEWENMITEVERLRTAAREYDIEIVSLKP